MSIFLDLKKVTVITVVKNGMPFVVETIQSIVNQDYQFIEYIVIDSLSTDGTHEYTLSCKDKITKLVCENDSGISDAFNKGLSLASGDYIMFINADDKLYKNNVVTSLITHARNNGYPTFLYGDCEVLDRNTGHRKYVASIKFKSDGLLRGRMPPHPSMLIHKNYFKKYGNFDLNFKIAMDFEWFIRGIKSSTIVHVPLIISSVRDGGISTRNQIKVIYEIILALKKNYYLLSIFKLITLWAYFITSYLSRIILTKLRIYKFIKKTGQQQ